MAGDPPGYERTDDGCFEAPFVVAYPYSRTVGDTLATFFTSMRDGVLRGTVGSDGTVYCPPAEFDPVSGAPCTTWADVSDRGAVTTWSWQAEPIDGHPLDRPFAWALIALDGSSSEMLHAVDAGSPQAMRTGMRVRARWAAERGTGLTDIACFEPEAAS